MKIPDYSSKVNNLPGTLHTNFEDLMSITGQNSKNESCSFMSLVYAPEISAHLVQQNSRDGIFSAICSVLYSLSYGYHFMCKMDENGKVFNMKVEED